MPFRRSHFGVLAIVCLTVRVALAAPATFTVNPAASTFEVGGTFNGAPLSAQAVGVRSSATTAR